MERPSPVNLLRAAVTGIGENTQIKVVSVEETFSLATLEAQKKSAR